TDRDGQELYGPHAVKVLGLDKTQIDEDEQEDAARELAGLLGTDADRYAQTVAEHGPEAFVTAVTIRGGDGGACPLDEAAEVAGFRAADAARPHAVERD